MFWSSHKEQQVRMYLTDVERTGERNHYRTGRHTAQSRWEMFYLYWYGCLALWAYIITGICLWFVIYLKSALHVFWNTLWNKLSFLLICIHLFHIYTHSSLYIYIYTHIYSLYIHVFSYVLNMLLLWYSYSSDARRGPVCLFCDIFSDTVWQTRLSLI